MFWNRKPKTEPKTFDRTKKRPVIRASICTGEQTACFQNLETGKLEEIMLLRTPADRAEFLNTYGIREEELETVY
ncbi:MAG: aspartate dehydrogenase [Clostridiales bacterium]|nr:aspartate dehydrogenase [Clostridiales bacterium]